MELLPFFNYQVIFAFPSEIILASEDVDSKGKIDDTNVNALYVEI